MKPVLQLALDFVDLPRALLVAEEAVAGGADWLEAGHAVDQERGPPGGTRAEGPLAGTRRGGRHEDHGRRPGRGGVRGQGRGQSGGRARRRLGRHHQGVRGSGPQLRGRDHRGHGPGGRRGRPRQSGREQMGASYIGIHIAIDEQMQGKTPWDTLREVAQAVSIPIAVAGGHQLRDGAAGRSRQAPPSWWSAAPSPRPPTPPRRPGPSRQAIETLVPAESEFFVRATGPDIRDMLAAGLGGQRLRRPAPQRRYPRACGRWPPA